MNSKFVKIFGVKIPFKNIRSTPVNDIVGGWISYKFRFTSDLPPHRGEVFDRNFRVPNES